MNKFFTTFLLVFLLIMNSAFAMSKEEARRFFHLNPKHNLHFLPIKGYQQTTPYTCGPAVAMSLLHYYGKLSDREMNHQTEMRIVREMGTTEAVGTSTPQLLRWLNCHGFKTVSVGKGNLKLLRDNLAKGIPVLVDWIDWGGHWVAVAGYDDSGSLARDTIFFADSAAHDDNVRYKDGITFINADRFNDMWFNSKHVEKIYIIATPK